MEWLDLLTAAGGGGILSLIGVGVQHFMDYKNRKLQYQHEMNMADKRVGEMEMEIKVANAQGAQALKLEREKGANEGLLAALEAEQSISGASQWVTDLRGAIRPVLTITLVFIASVFVTFAPAHTLADDFMFLATAAVLFWFGDRARKK